MFLFSLFSSFNIPLISSMESRYSYPQIISHRGACGYLPEHSLQSHQLAIDLSTDYIEPDLCLSKDGIFIVMHDITLDDTTDILLHPEFADRYRGGLFLSFFTFLLLFFLYLFFFS